MPALGTKGNGFVGIDRYVPVLEGVLNTPHHKKFLEEAKTRLKAIDPSGPLPDRYVQSNYEGINALKVGMQKSGFRGREDTMKLIEALEGLDMKEGDDFPQGDKHLRREDHQAFVREFLFEVRDGKHKILEVVPKEKTVVPAACKFA
jgi:branched-chain amino acid transport system substrate-binding protein